MPKKLMIVAGVALVVGLALLLVAGTALAQEPTPTPTPKGFKLFGWRGWGFGCWGGSWASFDAVAEALGLTPEQLFSELHGGKSITDLAEEKGVSLEALRDAVAASQKEAMRQAIEQAVQDGRLSREQADWMLQGLEKGWWRGWGRGFGRGFGHGWWGIPKAPSTPAPGGTRWFQAPSVAPGSSV